jgi:DNA-binding beta-propeller fold protein YncE
MRVATSNFAQRFIALAAVLICTSALSVVAIRTAGHQGAESTAPEYIVYVVSEAADKITRLRFGPSGGTLEREIVTGMMPVDIDGPHGLAVSPDRQFYYVTLGHGQPFGWVLKYSVRDDRVLGQTMLGAFPASMDLTPDGNLLFVVNFNLHGDMAPSTVSVVATDEMLEVKRIPTCTMPHGSRLNASGTAHYSACMMDDLLVEIDTRSLQASRHFLLTAGHEHGRVGPPSVTEDHKTHGAQPGACSPTWAQPSLDGVSVFVACNQSNEIVEVDAHTWALRRRIPAGPGVYNLAITSTGRLVASNKRDQSVSIFDVVSGREFGRVQTARPIVHGVAVTRDGHYAFISVEGIGSEPGAVEMIDLIELKRVAAVDVAPQAAGLDLIQISPPARR